MRSQDRDIKARIYERVIQFHTCFEHMVQNMKIIVWLILVYECKQRYHTILSRK